MSPRMAAGRGPRDKTGALIKAGAWVRVIGVPDLSNLSRRAFRETAPVFEHILGSYRKVSGFDHRLVELTLRIRRGPRTGIHFVWIEPELLRVRRTTRR